MLDMESLDMELKDNEWELEYIDHNREIVSP